MFAIAQGVGDDVLLDHGDLGEVNLHPHVSPGDHHAVHHGQDLVHVVHALLVFQFGDDAHVGVVFIQHPSDLHGILGGAAEGGGDKVKPLLDAEADIRPVLGAHIGHGQVDAGDVDPLAVLDRAAVLHPADYVGLRLLHHFHADQAVIQHDLAAQAHILGQVFIGDAANLPGAGDLPGGEGKVLAGLQVHLSLFKGLQADLWSLGVQQGGHRDVQFFAQVFEHLQPALVVLVGAMGEVEAGHIHAAFHHGLQDFRGVRGRTQGADNFGLSHRAAPPFGCHFLWHSSYLPIVHQMHGKRQLPFTPAAGGAVPFAALPPPAAGPARWPQCTAPAGSTPRGGW